MEAEGVGWMPVVNLSALARARPWLLKFPAVQSQRWSIACLNRASMVRTITLCAIPTGIM